MAECHAAEVALLLIQARQWRTWLLVEDSGTLNSILQDDQLHPRTDMAFGGSIFLRLRIADKEDSIRNMYFPFEIENDTALSVGTEMVAELDINDQDVIKIADMIDGEITSLVPEWNSGPGIEETPQLTSASYCHDCLHNSVSNGPLMDYRSLNNGDAENQEARCSIHGCAAMHGRFEEVTYRADDSEHYAAEEAPSLSSQSDGAQHTDIWLHHGGPEESSRGSAVAHSDEEHGNDIVIDKNVINMANHGELNAKSSRLHSLEHSSPTIPSSECTLSDDYESDIMQELRWLKAKYQLELRELKNRRLGGNSKTPIVSPNLFKEQAAKNEVSCSSGPLPIEQERGELFLRSFASGKHFFNCLPARFQNLDIQNDRHCVTSNGSSSPEHMLTAKSFYTGAKLPTSLCRATSLPVDAVDSELCNAFFGSFICNVT